MTKKLEEILDLPPIEEVIEQPKTKDELVEEAGEIINALDNSEKIDYALTSVTGLIEHDEEMDDIALKAITTYKELCDLGLNVPDLHVGKVYEVAAMMLRTAMEAKDAKVQKKLKMLDLQIKKYRIDKLESKGIKNSDDQTSPEFDRNELLQHIIDSQVSDK